jgi:hypothetical protein
MDMTCLADCKVSGLILGLLYGGAVAALAAAWWSRWSLVVTVPALLLGLGYVSIEEDWTNPWRAAIVLGIPLLGALLPRVAARRSRTAGLT